MIIAKSAGGLFMSPMILRLVKGTPVMVTSGCVPNAFSGSWLGRHNKQMHSDSKKLRSFVASHFAAGDLRRYAAA